MKIEQFLERYKKAIERLAILCSISEEIKSSLKRHFDMKIVISEAGDEITVSEYFDSYNTDVNKAFQLSDTFLNCIGSVIDNISDEQVERLLVECEELFTENGLTQASIAMEQIQVELFETSLAADAQKIAAEEFGLAKNSEDGFTMTPMQMAIYVYHGDVFSKLMTAQALIRQRSSLIGALENIT